FEREMIGLYVSDHPLQGLTQVLEQHADHSVTQVLDDEGPSDGAFVTISGLITSLERRVAKTSGNPYARAEVEDVGASIDVMLFGRVYEPISSVIAEDLSVSIKVRVQRREDGSVVISGQEMTIIDTSYMVQTGHSHLS